ncbi:MAG: hypothetical protein FWC71_00300 [Defluviitaleaceae bacterium]|nr:hypothetical protein [Defluviitaleaceae bacterium]
MIKINNDQFDNAVHRLAQSHIPDCRGGCNEIAAAAQAYLDKEPGAIGRLHSAAKSTLATDDACGHHSRDDLLCTVAACTNL